MKRLIMLFALLPLLAMGGQWEIGSRSFAPVAISPSGPAYVQGEISWGAPATATFTSNVGVGDAIVVAAWGGYNFANPQYPTITDTLGSGFVLVASINYMSVWVALNSAGSPDAVTATSVYNPQVVVAIHEYSGVVSASAVDGSPATASYGSYTPTFTVGPVTTTASHDLLFTAMSCSSTATESSGPTGFTVRLYQPTVTAAQEETADNVVTPGVYSAVWQIPSGWGFSYASDMVLVALKGKS